MHDFSRKLTLSGLFIALSIFFPLIFHSVGLGIVFLPMLWPVAAGAFFLPVAHAGIVGIFSPTISMLLTGMPPIPMYYIVCIELMLLGSFTSALYLHTRLGIFLSLLAGLFASQLGQYLAVLPLAPLLGLPSRFSGYLMVMKGVPGLASMLILIPLIVAKIKHKSFGRNQDVTVP